MLPAMLHSPHLRGGGGAALFPRLLCQYSTGAGKTRGLPHAAEVLAYNRPHLEAFHRRAWPATARHAGQRRQGAAPTYLCHPRRSWTRCAAPGRSTGPTRRTGSPSPRTSPRALRGRRAPPDPGLRGAGPQHAGAGDRHLFPGLNNTVKDEAALPPRA